MTSLWKLSVAAAMVALLVESASAQLRGRGFGSVFLLENVGVRKELKLTEEQIGKIKEITNEVREKHKEEIENLRAQPPEELREKVLALRKSISDETTQALQSARVMAPEQVKRFHQIELQVQGPGAFNNPKVAEKLKLNDVQKEKIKTITDDMDKERPRIFQNAKGNFQEGLKKMITLNKATMEKASAVLTDDQKKAWKDMTGEPFEFKFTPRPRAAG